MIVAPHINCAACSKKIVAHKVKVKCSACIKYYHTRCANLTPNDVVNLECSNLYRYWTCITCTQEIFPFTCMPIMKMKKQISFPISVKMIIIQRKKKEKNKIKFTFLYNFIKIKI